MNPNYTSFLICEHEQTIHVYLEGQPVATYYKKTDRLEIAPGAKPDAFQRIEDIVTSVLLLLKTNASQISNTVNKHETHSLHQRPGAGSDHPGV